MKKGRTKKVQWNRHVAPLLWDVKPKEYLVECGAYALQCITKHPLHKIMAAQKSDHWPTKMMLDYLRDHGFMVEPITLGSVVEANSIKDAPKPGIGERNVILIDQGAYREESTWSVIHGGMIAHSGEIEQLDPLEFLNWPILAAYVVTHKDWAR